MKTFMFMYLLSGEMETVRKSLGAHVKYWKNLQLEQYRNGPFTDKSGGLILFSVESAARAEAIVAGDPLLTGKAIRKYWLKEWVP